MQARLNPCAWKEIAWQFCTAISMGFTYLVRNQPIIAFALISAQAGKARILLVVLIWQCFDHVSCCRFKAKRS
ncbi:hypothetical protein HPP92_000540 [Vanilla planifolia]|uniref:Uncharacterized protein n=1 Tax=Vanilla planifolia TaxID=51239 RepID=A0A835VCP6_VANPL|nr:hypothetical protein HPP92_000540 [Vanilla planifolia]